MYFFFFFEKTKLDQKTGHLSLDIKSILDDCKDITLENDWVVYNLPKVPKQKAAENLHEVLVKGLFIYFLAKFAHGPVFRVKLQYYIVSSNSYFKDPIVVVFYLCYLFLDFRTNPNNSAIDNWRK